MKSKTKKIIIFSIVGASVLYLGGGFVAAPIVNSMIFGKRLSDDSFYNQSTASVFKLRRDFPLLENRKTYTFESGDNRLSGYYYEVSSPKGLVIACHGLRSFADWVDAEYQNWFVENGYSVFAIDTTASGQSEGSGVRGLYQSAYDVKNAYDFVKKEGFCKDNVILIGHSMGGFGVAASLGLGAKADRLITLAAFDNPFNEMLALSRSAVGVLTDITFPTFAISEITLQGGDIFMSASKAINESKTKSLIIQGDKDKTVPLNDGSLYQKLDENDYVQKLLIERADHSGIYRSKEANSYYNDEVKPKVRELEKANKEEELKEYLSTVDKEKTSELSKDVFDAIEAFLK